MPVFGFLGEFFQRCRVELALVGYGAAVADLWESDNCM